MLTFEQIKELIDLVSDRRLQGLEVERAGFRLRIEGRRPAGRPASSAASAPPPETRAAATRPAPEPAEEEAEDEGDVPADAHLLRSPIVGTFYTSPSPDAEAYAHDGDRVKQGQVLCIVEAMKLMNEIESDVDGTIVKIFPQNAQPVEYGEPLFAIRPD